MRKIAYQFTRDGKKVCVVDISPVRGTEESLRQWEREALRVTEAISAHTGKSVTARGLRTPVLYGVPLGKLASVVALCAAASLAGAQLIGDDGKIAGVPVRYAVNDLMLCAGIYFLIQWVRERRVSRSCRACGHCASAKDKIPGLRTEHLSAGFLWTAGAGYGLTPCAPLMMVLLSAAALPIGCAVFVGCVFSVASSLSPMLFLLPLSGALGGQMRKEIPQYLSWFRLACYLCLIVCASANLL